MQAVKAAPGPECRLPCPLSCPSPRPAATASGHHPTVRGQGPELRGEGRGESLGPVPSWGSPRCGRRNGCSWGRRGAVTSGGASASPPSKTSTGQRKPFRPGLSTRKGNLPQISAVSWSPSRVRLTSPSSSHLHWPVRLSSREAGPLREEGIREKA